MTCLRRVITVGLGPMLVLVAGCGRNTPVAPTAPTPHPPPISALTISTLPAALTVGQVVPLTASVTLPSGGQKQIADVSWQSSNAGVAMVSSTGVVTVTGFGVADIVARAYGQSATTRAFAPAPPRINLKTVIDSRGSLFGLCDATNITFDLSASTGAELRYGVAYGDGASASDALSRHVFGCKKSGQNGGSEYVVEATVTDVLSRTDTVTRTIALVPLTYLGPYAWDNFVTKPATGQYDYRRLYVDSQVGRDIAGRYQHPGGGVSPFTGTMSGENTIDIVISGGGIRMTGPVIVPYACYPARTSWS